MIMRLLNVILLTPMLGIIILFNCVYPIIGYIIGRGFNNSITLSSDLFESLFETNVFIAFYDMYSIIRYGDIK